MKGHLNLFKYHHPSDPTNACLHFHLIRPQTPSPRMSDPIIVDDSHLECTIKECYRIVSADGLDYNGTTTVLQKGSTLSFTFSGTYSKGVVCQILIVYYPQGHTSLFIAL